MIKVTNITKKFGKKTAVDNLSLEVKTGQVWGFLGPNGAGKTTTIKMLLGLARPTSGTMTINGTPAGSIAARRQLGYLPEVIQLYQHLSGWEFMLFIGDLFGLSKTVSEARATELLTQVKLIESAWRQPIGSYSKGMRQRLGLAQALVHDPAVVLLDEPMSGLDPIGRKDVKETILALKAAGKTIFFNSHILADAEEICDKVSIIHNGKLLKAGTVKQLCGKLSLEAAFVKIVGEADAPAQKKPARRRRAATKKTTTKRRVASKK